MEESDLVNKGFEIRILKMKTKQMSPLPPVIGRYPGLGCEGLISHYPS
jgi:hypothetical protein